MSKFTSDETLDKWFAHHAPSNDEIILAHETIRMRFRQLAQVLNDLLPEVPDKTVALRALRDAMYHANACVAVEQRLYHS